MKGDGNFREANRQTFVQKDKRIIDNVQALAVRLGYSTTIRKRSTLTWSLYKTNSITRWLHKENGSLLSTKKYTGMIWCPKTEKGTWIARRNGRVFITGNTFPEKLVNVAIGLVAHKPVFSIMAIRKSVRSMAKPIFDDLFIKILQPICTKPCAYKWKSDKSLDKIPLDPPLRKGEDFAVFSFCFPL